MISDLFLRLRARTDLSQGDRAVLENSVGDIRQYGARKTIVQPGELVTNCSLLVEGIVVRFKDLQDGRRQLLGFHIPGDFIDLHSFLLRRLEHGLMTMTAVRLATIPHVTIQSITEQHPRLARAFWLSTLMDAAMHREWTLTMGRRSAKARLAHLFCEMRMRYEAIGQYVGNAFPMPLTQSDLSDACGLTPVHLNRVLQQLRQDGLVTSREGRVTILNWDQLVRIAEFDPTYLYMEDFDAALDRRRSAGPPSGANRQSSLT